MEQVMEKNQEGASEELRVMTALKKKGYKYAIQFEEHGKKMGEPLTFKSSTDPASFMRENPDMKMVWVKKIDEYIDLLLESIR